jgi:hypothetical protein
MVNTDAAILLTNLDTESMKAAQQAGDPFLLKSKNGEHLSIDEIRMFMKAAPEDFDAAIDVLKIELELTKKSKQGDRGHDDEPEA